MKLITFSGLMLVMSLSYKGLTYQDTPKFGLPMGDSKFYRPSRMVMKYGNTDDFFAYMKAKRKYYSHTNLTVPQALDLFRSQLAKGEYITVELINHGDPLLIGGWDGTGIKMNQNYIQADDVEIAGTLYHEIAHKYGWKHKGNNQAEHDNANSFPYAVGIDLREYMRKDFVKYPWRK